MAGGLCVKQGVRDGQWFSFRFDRDFVTIRPEVDLELSTALCLLVDNCDE
jgi:hypothetical protein